MNLQTIHVVQLICGSLGVSLPALGAALPPAATPYVTGAAAIFVLLGTVLGVVSPSAASTKDGAK